MDTKITDRTIPKEFLKYIPSRDTYLLELCKGNKVLHIGASDWPYTKERYERGDLLYERIGKVASEQLGVDLDQEASDFLNEKKIPNSRIEVLDMNELHELSFRPDVIIFGETLEHLMNLGVSLKSIKSIMGEETKLVISVPNSFHFLNFVYALFRKEHQHPDHSVAFTYKTLTQLLGKAELKVKDFAFTCLESSSDTQYLNWKGKVMLGIIRIFTVISPVFAETLMVTATKNVK